MGQVTGPIVINNGASTPVAKSFLPMSVATALSVFTERSAPFSAGYARIEIGFSPANGGRKTNRIPLKVDLPVVEQSAGVDTVTRVLRFQGEFIIPDTATATERANLHAYVANALDADLIVNVVRDLDPLY